MRAERQKRGRRREREECVGRISERGERREEKA